MRTKHDIEKELNENIPREVVESRQAGGGRSLSYLPAWYVIDRLNRVFGSLGWDSETRDMRLVSDNPARYVSTVRVTVSVPEVDAQGNTIGFRSVFKDGTGWGSDKPRKDGSVDCPHEMAAKEAESDALKRAAMKLGISMGLGLYEKTGEYVEEAPKQEFFKQGPDLTNTETNKHVNRDTINKGIKNYAEICDKRGKKSLDNTKKDAQARYGVDKIPGDLSDDQAQELLNELRALANG